MKVWKFFQDNRGRINDEAAHNILAYLSGYFATENISDEAVQILTNFLPKKKNPLVICTKNECNMEVKRSHFSSKHRLNLQYCLKEGIAKEIEA